MEFFACFPLGRNDGSLAGFGVNKQFHALLSTDGVLGLLFHSQFCHNKFIFDRLNNRWLSGSMLVLAWLHVFVDIALRSMRKSINN
jgi:hypothetical protein